MKTSKLILACATALAAVGTAQADTVVHITGSTAFRAATITAIQNVFGGAGTYKAAYGSTTGSSTTASNRTIIQGTIATLPAAGVVTVKCSWSGSTGGIKTVVQNIDVTTWPSITNLPATNTSVGITDASLSFALDTGTFPSETAKADVTMEDSAQASTGFTTSTLSETNVGVVVFEWVVGNGAPAGLTNMTPLLAQATLSGGVPLSQFTGVSADVTAVYAMGRDFDSGTRLSELAETGVGVFGGVQQIQPIFTGTAGAAGSSISKIKLWQSETVLGQLFQIGQSGYSSGGQLADALATPGSATADTTTGIAAAEQVGFGPGNLLAYLGRSDAARACKTSAITGNTAKRLNWNGYQLTNGPILATGSPTSYNDNLVTEGLYSLWEYEKLAYRSSYTGNGKAVADKIANQIINTDATVSGIKLSTMNVSRAVEGGVITHL